MRAVLFVLLPALLGCEVVAGLDRKSPWNGTDAGIPDGVADVAVEADGALPPGCELPAAGSGLVRVGNLVPSVDRFDFCFDPPVRDSDLPIVRAGGADCPIGLGYRDITTVLRVSPGAYDVRVVDAATGSCADAVMNSVRVDVDSEGVTDLFLMEDRNGLLLLKVLRESRPSTAGTSAVRAIHAAPGEGATDVGYASSSDLPSTMTQRVFAGITFGGPAPSGSGEVGPIDENGYVTVQMGGGVITFGAGQSGQVDLRQVTRADVPLNDAATLFLVGRDGDRDFPLELFGCSEGSSQGLLARCGSDQPIDVTVAMYQVYLNGVWGVEAPRRAPLLAVVPAIDADVLVVAGVWSEKDKEDYAAAASAAFPYSYYPKTDLVTPFTDPRDANGNVPPAYEEPPCALVLAELEAALDCARDHCTDGGTEDSLLVTEGTTACLTKHCFGNLIALSSPEGNPCWSCLLTFAQSYHTIGETRHSCSTDPLARFAYDGSHGTLVLSKYPLTDSSINVLPATYWRAALLGTTVVFGESRAVDLYAGGLTYLNEDCLTRPYTGHYGLGEECPDAYFHEMMLQSDRVLAWIDERSSKRGRRSIVVLDTDTGIDFGQGLTPRNPEAYEKLAAVLSLAVAPDYVPACTFCADNPLVTPPGTEPTGVNTWTQLIFRQNLPITAVLSTDRFLTEAKYEYADGDNSYLIPPSYYYGLRSRIRLTP